MASPSVTYTFSNGTTADASQVNQNFTDIINGLTDGTKDLSISALTCAGNVAFNGNTTIGNASGDDLTLTASLASAISIKTTNTYDFGSTTKGLQRIYFGSSAGSNTTRLAGSAVTADVQLTLPSMTGTLALQFGVRTETDNYTAALTDGVILMNIAAAKTVTLPAVATAASKIYIIKKVDATGFPVTIDADGAETIEGATTFALRLQGQAVTIYCTGSDWKIIDRFDPPMYLMASGNAASAAAGDPLIFPTLDYQSTMDTGNSFGYSTTTGRTKVQDGGIFAVGIYLETALGNVIYHLYKNGSLFKKFAFTENDFGEGNGYIPVRLAADDIIDVRPSFALDPDTADCWLSITRVSIV